MGIIGDFISGIFKCITEVCLYLLDLLPDSPFGEMLDMIGSFDFLPYLNWFIPFDMAFTFFNLWLTAVALYYVYKYSKQIYDVYRTWR